MWAGIGGEGGDHNNAKGGDVDVNILNDLFNSHETYHIDDLGMGHG